MCEVEVAPEPPVLGEVFLVAAGPRRRQALCAAGFWVRRAKPLTSERCLLLLTTQSLYLQSAANGGSKAAKRYPLRQLLFGIGRAHV